MKDNNAFKAFDPGLFEISTGTHRDKQVIWLDFRYDDDLIKLLKTHTSARWSQSNKKWYIIDTPENRVLCKLRENGPGKINLIKINENNRLELERFRKMIVLKGYSPNTVQTYSNEFLQLLYTLKRFPVQDLSPEKLQSYFLYCAQTLKISENTIHSRMNAIKFYFENVLNKPKMFLDIPRPKKPKALPQALKMHEVKRLFEVTTNLKHRMILALCYGMGLRVSEIVNLKVEDVDSHRMMVMIKRGQGKKDRYVTLPESVLADLRTYYKTYNPVDFLFEGEDGGQYSTRSAQKVFEIAMKKARIKKTIGVHGLPHNYATQLLELGTDISLIQKLLGHNDIKNEK